MHPYRWEWDLEAAAVVPVLCLGYAVLAVRFRIPRARIVLFALAQLLLLAAFATPLESLALHYLLTAHLLQNVVLAEWAPALIVLALPAAVGRYAGPLVRPLVALPVWVGTYFLWHAPFAYDAALRRPHSLLLAEHLCYLAAGLLLWWPVVHDLPRRLGSGGRALYLFAAFVLASPLGLLLALLPRSVYSVYTHAPRVWGLSPVADQQIAGLTMASEQAAVLFVVFLVFFVRFLGEESRSGMLHELRS